MAQSRSNESSSVNMMQQPPQQVQQMPTQRYDLTQPMMAPPGNGMSSLLDSNDGRQEVYFS
jgi:hypothetical protein